MADLKHRDWLIHSTIKMVQSVDPNIQYQIITPPDGSMHLILNGIIGAELPNLFFLTNTDNNNNYLYLENFEVYINGNLLPLNIQGLVENMKNVWYNSDINAFLINSKTQYPFNNPFNNGLSIDQYIDQYTSNIPWSTKTTRQLKTYKITLNPDCVASGQSSLLGKCCNGNPNPYTGMCP